VRVYKKGVVSVMKITKLETFLVGEAQGWGPGNYLLVKITTDAGITGVGECYACGKARTTESAVHELGRWLIGKNPLDIEHHWQVLYNTPFHRGWILNCALAGVDLALYDIAGKHFDTPVFNLLGGRCRSKARVYGDIFYAPTIDGTVENIRRLVDEGYTAVKTTPIRHGGFLRGERSEPPLTGDTLVKLNVEFMKAIRQNFGDTVDIALDFAGGFSPRDAIRLCQALEDYAPLFVEEPVRSDKVEALVQVSSSTDIPIAAGERIYSLLGFRRLLEAEAVDIIQPDLSMTGLLPGKKIAAMAEAYEVKVAPHTPLSYVQWAASLHLDAGLPNFFIQEVIPSPKPMHAEAGKEIVVTPFQVEGGYLPIPTDPGQGVELNEAVLASYPYTPFDRPQTFHEDGSYIRP
jgi:galactonate dehydratase